MKQRISKKYLNLALFVLPALAFFTVFVVYPLADTLRLSLYTTDISGKFATFVGLDNYSALMLDKHTSPVFWAAFGRNIEYFLLHLLVELPIGLLIAALLSSDRLRKSAGIYRTLLFIPTTLSVVVTAFIWRMILNPLWGLMDFPLLGDETTALPTIAMLSVWQYIGVPMILFYTTLLNIPRSLIESARLDGASSAAIFWRVKFPLILPMFGLNAILTYIFTFVGAFDMIFSLEGIAAGPNFSTDILGTLFYRVFYGMSGAPGNPNLGAAAASIIFIFIMICTALYFLFAQRKITSYEMS